MKKTINTNGQSANTIFVTMQTPNPKEKKTRHTLLVWEEKMNKDSEKANKKSLFEDMLLEQRGIKANCRIFAQYSKDSRMMSVILLKGIKARKEDFAVIFNHEFIADNLREDFGLYRYNSKHIICRVSLPKTDEKKEEFEMLGYEKTEPNKNGKFGYLIPHNKYTFEQFCTLVKCAVENYRKSE